MGGTPQLAFWWMNSSGRCRPVRLTGRGTNLGDDSGCGGGQAMSRVRRPSDGERANGGVRVPDVGDCGGCHAFTAERLGGRDGKPPSSPLVTPDFGGGHTNCLAPCELWRVSCGENPVLGVHRTLDSFGGHTLSRARRETVGDPSGVPGILDCCSSQILFSQR